MTDVGAMSPFRTPAENFRCPPERWEQAWLPDEALQPSAALPVGPGASTEDFFAALEWRRLRLRQDQQVPEWTGVPKVAVGTF